MDTNNKQPPVGIDLGTTYSAIAYLDATGRPITIFNDEGDILTPSAVAFDDEMVIVGKEAIKGSVVDAEGFGECFKRDIGRPLFRRPIRGREVPPEVLSAFLLEHLKEYAERRLGPIRKVVITVPAFFDELRRKATEDAGRLAGLDVLDIINEPTAAAIAFGYQRASLDNSLDNVSTANERILVYDLGGGTFDVTVLEIDGDTYRALATDGDVQLGGKDFDQRIVDAVADAFLAEHGLDPRSDPQDAAQLWIDAESVKRALSKRNKMTLVCSHAGIRMRQEITRTMLEELTSALLSRTETTTELVMKQAGLEWTDVGRILLVGGSSRMPMVEEMLRRLSGKEPDRSQSADEAVAHGAALYAGMLMADRTSNQRQTLRLVNVNSHSLGVAGTDPVTGERVNKILIPKNTTLPCRKTEQFQTARANQATVQVTVVEGESQRPDQCIILGKCLIRDLPPNLPKGSRVDVEYQYNASGRISVTARVPLVRQGARVEVERHQAQDLHDLVTWRRVLCGLEDISAETGQAGSSAGKEQPNGNMDRPTLIQKLDNLYAQVGERLVNKPVPERLEKSKQSALTTVDQLRRFKAALKHAETLRQAAVGRHDIVRYSADVARAKQTVKRATTTAKFALVVLGRECVDANSVPPDLQTVVTEIRKLQECLSDGT